MTTRPRFDDAELERLARACEIQPYRSSGPGGQKKNKTESSVRARHLATGITRIATESRSQSRNRQLALERVAIELARRAKRRRPRVATLPTRSAIERRLESKHRAARIKRERRASTDE
ncbi:MAG: peptide chain release factor-like protein [Candidatus Eisenbacteria bacterium]|nr:peptide chain release factor-like protein [Candidatus Eisenbacteria bacterium]